MKLEEIKAVAKLMDEQPSRDECERCRVKMERVGRRDHEEHVQFFFRCPSCHYRTSVSIAGSAEEVDAFLDELAEISDGEKSGVGEAKR